MKFTIVLHKERVKEITRYEKDPHDINKSIFEILTGNGIDAETAVDCASWCEIADPDDSYNEEDFDVYVEEE